GRAILVGVHTGDRTAAEASLQELQELARTADVQVLDVVLQARREIDPRTLIGEGKLQEILVRSMALGADLLVFDRDLSPSQARHISEATSLRIIDRTQLILDIFARRARSADGKLQVELAQLKYLLPRLVGRDDSLSVLAGDVLFATLDPTSRRLRLPHGDRAGNGNGNGERRGGAGEVVITDTVGFIRDLPRDLVAAFRATLEELEEADLLLHVVDAS